MNPITLPDSLWVQFRAYEVRLKKMETLAAVCGGAAGVLASLWLLFVCDRFGDTPRLARIALTLGGGALAAWFAHGWAKHWLWNKRGPAQLARLLQAHFKGLGDTLQGVVELTQSADLPANVSPALMRAAIRQVAADSSRLDFTQAVPVRPARRFAMAAGVFGVLVLLPFLVAPRAAINALARWVMPWASIERYTFAAFEALPETLVVAHGEPFEIACGLRADSAWRPQRASARLAGGELLTAGLKDGHAVFRLPGQTQEGRLSMVMGDASRDVLIRPMHRPEMKELAARVELPAYLGYPPEMVPVQGSSVEFVEGSSVRFSGKTSRALKEVAMKSGESAPGAVIENESFQTLPVAVGRLGNETTFQWADAVGLTPAQPYTVRVSLRKDAEPRVELSGIEQETAMLPDEILDLKVAASDDFGVRESWLGWTLRKIDAKADEKPASFESARVAGSEQKRDLLWNEKFSPTLQKIPEDSVVELAAYTVDYRPERKPVESWKHTIHVLSLGRHSERVRERMELALKQLNDRIRDEERQLDGTSALLEDKVALDGDKAGEEIKREEAAERTNETQLQSLVAEMTDIIRDALRNKEIPEGTVADWQNIGESLEKKAAPSMQDATGTLARGGELSGEAREPLIKRAKVHQQDALEAMRNIAKKMNTANENLFARNFYNRMRAAAAAENGVADALKELPLETVGLPAAKIPAEHAGRFEKTALGQETVTKNVATLHNEMGAFLKRVQNEKYAAVEKEMGEKRVVGELGDLSGYVRANLRLKSVNQARQWGAQLDEWATMLQSECKCQGGGGEIDPDLMELIVALVRTAQAEDEIREQTGLLDSKKPAADVLSESTGKLAARQDALRTGLDELREKTRFDQFKPAMAQAAGLMGEVAGQLRAPRTDEDVVSNEGIIIEMLVPPDKKGGKSAAQQMMQKMMAQATKSGKGGGGNKGRFASNVTSEDAAAQKAAVAAARAGARAVDKAGAAANAGEWPEEYRDQLQAYFQALEASNKENKESAKVQ